MISIIMPVYNTPETFLREAIQSVLDQVYTNWELCIADDASTASHIKPILEEYQQQDSRIKVVFRTKNGHISVTSNSALELATGEFIGLLDHDDVLTPDALYEVVSLLNQHPVADMIYSDEDKLNEKGELTGHFFKPDWCPDSFLSRMYTCHFGVYRREIINQIGGFRIGYEGSQDYDLVLRFTEKTDQIFHIPKILYHWRIHSNSTSGGSTAKPYAYEAGKRALQDAINRRGEPGIVKDVPIYLGHYQIRYKILDYKRVSIIIPTKDLGKILNRCLESIFTLSIYPDYEVIVIDNGSTESETQEILEKWQEKEPNRFRYYALDIPFNFSKINNYAVSKATGDYLLFLNNDTEVIYPDWIDAMVEQAQRPSIGAVGALLRYPDKIVQHAGVVVGIGHFAAHSHRLASETDPGYYGQIISISNYSAVTAACLMCRREIFTQVGGFDEQLAVAYNDVDFCLKIVEQGYRNIYLPHVVLYHYESKSRGYDTTPDKLKRFMQEVIITRQKWQRYIDHDPCYNPNLTLSASDYSLRQFAEVEISKIALDFDHNKLQDCSIDQPEIGTYYGISQICFKGWVLGKQEKITAVQIIGDHGQVIKEIPTNFSRPDVRLLHPENSNSEFCGFCETIELRNLSGQTELLFQAVLKEGTYAKFAKVKLKINH
jgi:Predicted glycosyltransferases